MNTEENKKIFKEYMRIVKTQSYRVYQGPENEGKSIKKYSLLKATDGVEYSGHSNSNLKNGYTLG